MENPNNCVVASISISGPIIVPPLVARSKFNSHIEGSTYGNVAVQAPIQSEVRLPGRKGSLHISSAHPMLCDTTKFTTRMMDDSEELTLSGRLSTAGSGIDVNMVVVEQRMPHGYTAILSKNLNCYLYGIYSESSVSLVITNVANYYDLVNDQGSNYYLVHRMGMHINLCTVFYTKRLCSRFFRYKTEGLSVPKMFSALERTLSNGI